MMAASSKRHRTVITRIRCGCEYENAWKHIIAVLLFFQWFFPGSRREAMEDGSENPGVAASLSFKAGLYTIYVVRLGRVI